MNIDYQDTKFFNVDYVYRIQTFEKYLANSISSEDHFANYKIGLLPSIFYEHNLPTVLSFFRKEFLEIKSGLERYEMDNIESKISTDNNII